MIIKNAKIITYDEQNPIIENGSIQIDESGTIQSIQPGREVSFGEDKTEEFDAKGQFVMPANICAHTHFYGAFSRGLYIPGDAPDAFPSILEKLWWKLDKSLDEEANYYSALVCLIDAIKHGTAVLIDHHASPNFIPGSLDVLEKAVRESGLRASLCYEVTDRDGSEKSDQGIEENVRFIKKTAEMNDMVISAQFGLHASLTLNDQTLQEARKQCPEGTGFHIHVAEHVVDEDDSLKKCGKRVVERLDQFGILGPKTIAAHGVYLDAREIQILAESGTWLSHQPRSNMNNAVGLPDVESMLNAGIPVCIGNDGFSNAMWQEWKAAYLGHKLKTGDPRSMPAEKIYTMAVINNRNLVNNLFNGLDTGIIKEGAAADLIIVDYKPFTDLNHDNLPWHIIFGFQDSMVTSTIVNGRFLMQDRDLVTLDEGTIVKEAKKVSKIVWDTYHGLF